jgi:hypothetical protein
MTNFQILKAILALIPSSMGVVALTEWSLESLNGSHHMANRLPTARSFRSVAAIRLV